MPIYEYMCQDCQTKFDQLRSMKDADAPITCKNCNGHNTRRAVSKCFSKSEGGSESSSSGHQCGGCSGGSCSSCGH